MAEKAEPNKKPKRRLRPAAESVRERVEKASQKAEQSTQKAARKLIQANKPKHKLWAPFRAVWRPVRWLGRHLIPRYFRGAAHELRLTTWPSRRESRQLTVAVIIFAIIFGAFISLLDMGFDKVFKKVILKQ